MLEGLKGRGIRLIVMKPPIPEHVYKMIPGEAEFDRKIKSLLSRMGTRNFIDGYLKDLLIKYK
ncbi:MAG: hypothetical protein M1379_12165 [Firmicutes bacterium]|nr:hypothetical protein [Bacillota bacterium]